MTFDPTAALQKVLDAHGIQTNPSDQGFLIRESDLVLSASVVRVQNHPTNTMVQLDVRAISQWLGGKLLIESFAGWGSDESEAAEQAFRKFLRASMHVLLAVLVDPRYGDDQVEWESWRFGDKTWQVCLGPVCFQGTPPDNFVCGELLDKLKEELLPHVSVGPHWIRFFFNKSGHEITVSELLVDNLDWPEGREIIQALDWPDGMYSAREFLMMHM
jgi:hypothetical protein